MKCPKCGGKDLEVDDNIDDKQPHVAVVCRSTNPFDAYPDQVWCGWSRRITQAFLIRLAVSKGASAKDRRDHARRMKMASQMPPSPINSEMKPALICYKCGQYSSTQTACPNGCGDLEAIDGIRSIGQASPRA